MTSRLNNLSNSLLLLGLSILSFDSYAGCSDVKNECSPTSYSKLMPREETLSCQKIIKSDRLQECTNTNVFECNKLTVAEPGSSWNDSFLESLYTFTCEKDGCEFSEEMCLPWQTDIKKYNCEESADFAKNMKELNNLRNTVFWTFNDDNVRKALSSSQVAQYENWRKSTHYVSKYARELFKCLGLNLNVEYSDKEEIVYKQNMTKDVNSLWYKYNNFFVMIETFTQNGFTEKGTMQDDCAYMYSKDQMNSANDFDTDCKLRSSNTRSLGELGIYLSYPANFKNSDTITRQLQTIDQQAKFISYVLVHEVGHSIITRGFDFLINKEAPTCAKKANSLEMLAKQVRTAQDLKFTQDFHVPNTLMHAGDGRKIFQIAKEATLTKHFPNICNEFPKTWGYGDNPTLKALMQGYINNRVPAVKNNECYKPCIVKAEHPFEMNGTSKKVILDELKYLVEKEKSLAQ